LIAVETETGRELSERERMAVEVLKDEIECFDVGGISQAVEQTVTAQSKEHREDDWSELKDRFERL
jgi:hypothetical protein